MSHYYPRNFRSDRALGVDRAANSSLAICGLARDCAHRLPNIIRIIHSLACYFKQVHVYVVENDSMDDTRSILDTLAYSKENRSTNSNHHVKWLFPDIYAYSQTLTAQDTLQDIYLTQAYNAETDSATMQQRVLRMAVARDCYLHAIIKDIFTPQYVLMIDMDVLTFSVSGILQSIGLEPTYQWDMVSANGRIYKKLPFFWKSTYADTYALELPDREKNPFDWNSALRTVVAKCFSDALRNRSPLVSVKSAFGGMALYKYDSIKNASYVHSVTHHHYQFCEHISFHHTLRAQGHSNMFINPSMYVHYNGLIDKLLRLIR